MTDVILDTAAELARISQQIELHRTAIWLLEDKRLVLQQQMRSANFKPSNALAVA